MSHATTLETHFMEPQGANSIPVSKARVWTGRAILFPIYMGALLWTGLYLRDRRLRVLVQLKGDRT